MYLLQKFLSSKLSDGYVPVVYAAVAYYIILSCFKGKIFIQHACMHMMLNLQFHRMK